MAHPVRGCAFAHPEPDLERPLAVALRGPFAQQFQRADERGSAAQLVEGEEAQRVAHDDAHARTGPAVGLRMPEPAEHHREGRKAKVRLRLAAAGGEEEEVHDLTVRVRRVGEPRQIQQQEGELEGAPLRILQTGALLEGEEYCRVRHPEGIERLRVVGEHRDAALHAGCRDRGEAEQLLGRFALPGGKRVEFAVAFSNPVPVADDERPEAFAHGVALFEERERRHREIQTGDFHGLDPFDLGSWNPLGTHPAAESVHEVPVRRDSVAGGEREGDSVVEVRNLLVPRA